MLSFDSRKEKRNPKFLSIDYFKFMVLEMMFLKKKDNLLLNRPMGFSEYIACVTLTLSSFLPLFL